MPEGPLDCVEVADDDVPCHEARQAVHGRAQADRQGLEGCGKSVLMAAQDHQLGWWSDGAIVTPNAQLEVLAMGVVLYIAWAMTCLFICLAFGWVTV